MKNIVMFDTSQGTQNIGDYIINDAINHEMEYLLDGNFVTRFSTHTPIARVYQNVRANMTSKACDNACYKFLCGTNLFKYSLLRLSPDWNINIFNCKYYKNSIALGCGIDVNAKKVDMYTKLIYQKILSKQYIHSVRDEKTREFLESLGFRAINTGCPTIWSLTKDFCKNIPVKKSSSVVFTLTCYRKNIEKDQQLINILKNNYSEVYFWVQGSEDYQYLNTLNNIENIKIVNPDLKSFKEVLSCENIEYVGTRLHAGIFAMKNKKRSIIISIDNRARNMAETYNINTIDIENMDSIEEKINSEFITNVNIEEKKIRDWKNQFNI